MLTFTVFGEARSKGNHRTVWRPGMAFSKITEKDPKSRTWQDVVAVAASVAIAQQPADARRPLTGGVRLTLAFYLPRPKSLPKSVVAHIKKIDLDKAVRGVGDALKGLAYRDDSQVCELVAGKYYVRVGEPVRVEIRVEPTLGAARRGDVPPAPLPLFTDELFAHG